jgi:ABC-type branched-subunit amino acid transport system substrate-binding protein
MKILFFCLLLALPILVFSNENELKICLTGSTEKALPKYGEAFVNGAQLAIEELSGADKKKVKLEVNYYESNPLAPVEKLDELRKASCDAIIGFSTGNDLLAIETSLKENPIFTLSIYGDPQDRFNKTNYLRTMQPSADDLVFHLFKNMPFKITKESKVLVVTAADRSEMLSYRDAYLAHIKDAGLVTQVEVMEQTHSLEKFQEVIKKGVKWDFVVILTRSLIAAEISDLLHKDLSPIILGTKYFGSSELPAFSNYLKNKKVQAYIPRQNCSCEPAPAFQKLISKYKKVYGVDPMSISIDSYDATKFVLQALKAPKQTSESVLKYLNSSNADFLGISSFKVSKGLKTSSSKRYVLKIDENGYQELK